MGSGRRPPRRSRARTGQRLAVALAWALAAAGSVCVLLGAYPQLQLRHPAAALAASFIPYGVLGWLVVTAVVLTSQRRAVRMLAILTIAAFALQVSWTLPYWPRVPAAPDGNLTVMALNTYYGWADPDRLMVEAERVRPDVVVLSEITHGTWDALRKRGWTELLPHHVGEPGDGWESHAMMIFSRHPLEQVAGDTDGAWATLRVAKPDGPCTVIAVHATNREHQPMREFADAGFTDAAEQAGAGWVPTWPSRRYDRAITSIPYPSVIAIDHVLLGPGMAAAGFHTFTVARTDHRGIVAELAVSGWSGTGRRR